MGGNAFPRTAARMSSEQHGALRDHALAALVPAFFPRAEPLRDVAEKADHGDLDLIAGWADERAWKLKGEERGVVNDELGLGGTMALKKKEDGGLAPWAYDMARALQAAEWVRRGSEISFAIPARVLGDAEGFYQLDVPFVPIDALDFYLVTVSYSTTFLILARAVRCISRAFTLQMVGLIVRHSAYPGIPGIDVVLTPSATELCDYLGLDLNVWKDGFKNELECWAWLADVKPGGMLEQAYRKMVKPRAVRQKGHKKKAGGLDAFVEFLRGTKWGEGWEEGAGWVERAVMPEVAGLGQDVCVVPGQNAKLDAGGEARHPDQPEPLDARAEEALDKWGKRTEYETILAERKVDAAYLYERQQKRAENRDKAKEREAKATSLEAGVRGLTL